MVCSHTSARRLSFFQSALQRLHDSREAPRQQRNQVPRPPITETRTAQVRGSSGVRLQPRVEIEEPQVDKRAETVYTRYESSTVCSTRLLAVGLTHRSICECSIARIHSHAQRLSCPPYFTRFAYLAGTLSILLCRQCNRLDVGGARARRASLDCASAPRDVEAVAGRIA